MSDNWYRCGVAAVSILLIGASNCQADERSTKADESPAANLVRQALDNELAGDAAGRAKLLAEAADRDADYGPAHWHLGQVRFGNDWMEAKAAMAKEADDPLNAEYQTKRDEASGNSALELKLAQWCIKEKMPDRARLHFWRVLTNPKVTEGQVKDAAKQLDLVSVGGTILTRDELKKEQEREKRIAEAIAKYRPILAQLQPTIDASFDESHDKAAEKLASIDDPAVIPAIETYVNGHQEGFGEGLVKLLTKFPQVEATQTLVRYAVVSPFLSVRERAISELKKRPLHDYVPTLLAGLVAPIQSQFRYAIDARGNVAYQQIFAQAGAKANRVSRQDVILRPVALQATSGAGGLAPRGQGGKTQFDTWTHLFGPELALMELALRFEAQQLEATAANHHSSKVNQKIFSVLEQTTGQQILNEAKQWWEWWQDYNQVHYPKPTFWAFAAGQSQYVASLSSQHITSVISNITSPGSCFLVGTPVWTETGTRPIESIRPGDRVLSQHPDTGQLCFKVVVGKTIRPPTAASKLTVNGEVITTTLGHPLWVAGKGWEMAKHIAPGDQLHGIHGVVNVNAIEPLDRKIEAHNLVVDDFNTYFVGNCGMLVHDNTYRKPTRALVPGLIPDEK